MKHLSYPGVQYALHHVPEQVKTKETKTHVCHNIQPHPGCRHLQQVPKRHQESTPDRKHFLREKP